MLSRMMKPIANDVDTSNRSTEGITWQSRFDKITRERLRVFVHLREFCFVHNAFRLCAFHYMNIHDPQKKLAACSETMNIHA
jgi:hypothetical protein